MIAKSNPFPFPAKVLGDYAKGDVENYELCADCAGSFDAWMRRGRGA